MGAKDFDSLFFYYFDSKNNEEPWKAFRCGLQNRIFNVVAAEGQVDRVGWVGAGLE